MYDFFCTKAYSRHSGNESSLATSDFLQNSSVHYPQTPGIQSHVLFIFLAKRKPVSRVFVGENKSLREMPSTAHITFLRCPMSTVKTRLELKPR